MNVLKTTILNGISVVFKTLSWVNLWFRGLRPRRFPGALIISVDNLSFGGTGKTTLVKAIGGHLEQGGYPFAIVTRGYKSKMEHTGTRVTAEHTAADVGDEALLYQRAFPNQAVYIGRNRETSIHAALKDNHRIILLDDGFQSTNLHKDITIMLFNPQHPYYYLRNFKFMMKREDHVLYFSPDTGTGISEADTKRDTYHFRLGDFFGPDGERIGEDRIRNATIFGFCGLGDNRRFRDDLSRFNLAGFRGFPDHHAFTEADIREMDRLRRHSGAQYLVCTEKDFIKIKLEKSTSIPLIYVQNKIKLSVDLFGKILTHAQTKSKI